MDNMTIITEKAINNYFKALSVFGTKSYHSVDKLLVFTYIELFMSDFAHFINEKDYTIIVNALYCLIGTDCIIDFPSYATYDKLIHENKLEYMLRATEDSILKGTQESLFRIEA